MQKSISPIKSLLCDVFVELQSHAYKDENFDNTYAYDCIQRHKEKDGLLVTTTRISHDYLSTQRYGLRLHTHTRAGGWAAVFHLSRFDLIIKTHFVDIILLGSFQVS